MQQVSGQVCEPQDSKGQAFALCTTRMRVYALQTYYNFMKFSHKKTVDLMILKNHLWECVMLLFT